MCQLPRYRCKNRQLNIYHTWRESNALRNYPSIESLSCNEGGQSNNEVSLSVLRHRIYNSLKVCYHEFDGVMIEQLWSNFQWHLTITPTTFHDLKYRQIIRAQNNASDNKFLLELTFFYDTSNLRSQYELCLKQDITSHTEVTTQYYGTKDFNLTMELNESTVIRITFSILKLLEKQLTVRTLKLATKLHLHPIMNDLKCFHDNNVVNGCRIVRKFINLSSIRQYTTLLTVLSMKCARICTLHVDKEISNLNKGRALHQTTITGQYKISLKAIKQEVKFLCLTKQSKCASQIQSGKQIYITVLLSVIRCIQILPMNIPYFLRFALDLLAYNSACSLPFTNSSVSKCNY